MNHTISNADSALMRIPARSGVPSGTVCGAACGDGHRPRDVGMSAGRHRGERDGAGGRALFDRLSALLGASFATVVGL